MTSKKKANSGSISARPLSDQDPAVLWIRVGALGDLLIATAALVETLRRFPEDQVGILGPKLWTQLIDPQLFPRVPRIYSLKGSGLRDGFQEWVPSAEGSAWTCASEGSFDAGFWKRFRAVVNHRIESHRFAIQPWLQQVPIRIGSGPWATRFLYTHWSPDLGKDPMIHERDWHLRVATAEATSASAASCLDGLSVRKNRRALNPERFFGLPSEVWRCWEAEGLPRLRGMDQNYCQRFGLSWKKFFLVNPTSSRREKAWTGENYARFLKQWSPSALELGLEPVVVGAPSETVWLKDVAGEEFRVIQPESVAELFHLVDGAVGLLTNASSMHFIAASTDTPAVVLMGRSDRRIWGPLGRQKWVVQRRPETYQSTDIFAQEQEAYACIPLGEVRAAVETCLREVHQAD